ncbi:leucyl aminopeptidase [Kineococcus rhizosphaerae]|uniref:Probable cytosol aminopeptidase n=1 Tax=Kineococcus rhizosphaerae TaxID=559628 RepID=A0A2T0R8I6_9ACTN|nr:leucyl aminopeptidase [Kineococcus rhizosphaerae]PRY17450.1 leucyl aminopeptidase [Kineococcus rhizosphaerae]
MPRLLLSSKSVKSVSVDALVLGLTPAPAGRSTAPVLLGGEDLPRATRSALVEAAVSLGATGAAGQVHLVPGIAGLGTSFVALAGVGSDPDHETLRRGAGAAVRALSGQRRVALGFPVPDASTAAALAEGAALGAYAFTRYRAATREPVAEVTLLVDKPRDKALRAAVERAGVVAAAVASARDLVNTAPADLAPADLAAAAVRAAAETTLTVRVLDEDALAAGGYGGILGVGQGSSRPPRLVVVEHAPARAKGHLAFVGKGITFDSGGLSIKPAAGMETMKSDMSGAAAVLAAVRAVAELGLPVKVTGWLAVAENMPSGTAIRPSDVLTMFGGTTVEVLNTDAEGRLVLGDALVAASAEQPDAVVDVATLTGAQVVALGNRVSGVMGNDDDFRAAVLAAAERAGESFWPMPLPDELRATLDSPVADLANIGDRAGGMLVAAVFLREFVGSGPSGAPIPWAHLDIAGPAFVTGEPWGYTHRGGTGVAVRTLVALAEDHAAR